VGQLRRFVEPIGLTALLTSSAAVLLVLGHGILALPPNQWAAWDSWLRTTDPTIVAFAFIRVCALVAIGYLALTTLLYGLALGLRMATLATIIGHMTAPPLQQMIQRVLGLSLAGFLAVPMAANAAPSPPSAEPPILHHLTSADPDPTFSSTTESSTPPSQPEPDGEMSQLSARTHVVGNGEDLWNIAGSYLELSLGRHPNTEEIRRYWLKTIETNRDRLVNPDDANLIIPGQIVRMPDTDE
jgi:hypothetical protein